MFLFLGTEYTVSDEPPSSLLHLFAIRDIKDAVSSMSEVLSHGIPSLTNAPHSADVRVPIGIPFTIWRSMEPSINTKALVPVSVE